MRPCQPPAEAVWQLLESGQVNALITTSDALFQHVDQLTDAGRPTSRRRWPAATRLYRLGWTISTLQPQQIDLSADFITVATAPEVIGSWAAPPHLPCLPTKQHFKNGHWPVILFTR